jgi:hypothetical protein
MRGDSVVLVSYKTSSLNARVKLIKVEILYITYRVIKKSLCTWWLQNTSILPHYLAESDCLAADRQGQGDTRLTLTPSVNPNSNYVNMLSVWNCLKYFYLCYVLYSSDAQRILITLCNNNNLIREKKAIVCPKLSGPLGNRINSAFPSENYMLALWWYKDGGFSDAV